MMLPSRERIGGSGGVPKGVIAGSLFRTSDELSGELSFIFWNFDASRPLTGPSLLIPNPRIEVAVSNVDQQIHQQEDDGNEGDNADDQGLVAI